MKKGYSLHIGLNKVNSNHYENLKDLRGAVNDAIFMADVAEQFKYSDTRILLDEDATSNMVLQILGEYSNNANTGDIVFVTYSGHGGQMEDPFFMNKGDEPVDETWCLFDRQLIDDELFEAFRKFKKGVRILIFSDSCHSGTVAKEVPGGEDNFDKALTKLMSEFDFQSKELSPDECANVFLKNESVYTSIQEKFKTKKKDEKVVANVQLFAACQDNQIAFDGVKHGRFTTVFKNLIEQGMWKDELDSSEKLFDALRKPFSYPTPNFFTYGGQLSGFGSFPILIEQTMNGNGNGNGQAPELPDVVIEEEKEVLSDYKVSIEFKNKDDNAATLLKIATKGLVEIKFNESSEEEGSNVFTVVFEREKYDSIWTLIHQLAEKADEFKIDVEIEPLESDTFPVEDDLSLARASDGNYEYLSQWFSKEDDPNPPLGWHLDDEHSQLATARDTTWEKFKNESLENVRIAHIDTGYINHPSLKQDNILKDLARTFIGSEKKSNPTAFDVDTKKKGDVHGHGTGTLGILAGDKIDPSLTEGIDVGYVGAIPFAEVVPIRTSDTVIIFNNKNFCEAMKYVIKTNCEVVTMSMGGKPSSRMARVIDQAYENGITIVSAAGNNILKGTLKESIGPETLIFPAKFARVLAACGACYNHVPYDFKAQEKYTLGLNDDIGSKGFSLQKMQGNWGPKKAMKYAIAAYTPNTPWLTTSGKIVKSGGGTSSATPQIAAAAALWIVNNKKGLKERGWYGTWKQAEAVRYALFNSADTSFAESEKYYGRGIIKAMDAIQRFPVENIKEEDLVKSPKSKSTWLGVTQMMAMIFAKQRGEENGLTTMQNTMIMEVQSILFSDPAGIALLENVDLSDSIDDDVMEKIKNIILKSDASGALKAFFQE